MRSHRTHALATALLAGGLALADAAAQPAPAPAPPGAAGAAPDVPLEKLLRVPSSALGVEGEPRRGGRTRGEWRAFFQDAETALANARKAVEDSRRKVEEIAPDQAWSMSAPGLPAAQSAPAEAPLDYKLRQQLRRQREAVAVAERRLQELSIEANLAEVPEDWRRPSAEAPKAAPDS